MAISKFDTGQFTQGCMTAFCPSSNTKSIIIITSIYIALVPSQWPSSKRWPFVITAAIRKSSQSFCLIQACCEAVPCTAYQHLDCNIPSNSVPNIALVNEARKVKWIAQAHNTLAVAGLKLTTFGLWGLQVSTRPHQMHLSAQQCQYTLTRWCCYHTYCTRI